MSGKKRNRSAVPQMRGRDLRSVLFAQEQADDKADVVLLNGYGKLANVYQLFRWLSSFSVTANKRGDAKNQEYWYKMVCFFNPHRRAQSHP